MMFSPDKSEINDGDKAQSGYDEKLIADGMKDVTETIKKGSDPVKNDEPKPDNDVKNSETVVTETAEEQTAAPEENVGSEAEKPEKAEAAQTVKKSVGISDYLLQLKNGVLDQNPILVQLLGTCPTLATTTSVTNALGMGLAATAVLMCSNLLISLLRRIIPKQIRIAAYIVIISGFVTAVEMLIKAYFPALNKSLGVFIPLIVVNCIILARAEAFASKNPPLPSFVDGFAMGAGFTLALVVLGAIRELLGTGGIAGINLLGASYKPALLFIMPPGAFITLGFIIALVQKARMINDRRKAYAESGVTRAQLKEERRADKLRARAEKEEKLRVEKDNKNAEAEEERELSSPDGRESVKK